ncbi:MAG TPA: alpha/beta fold hydrolase [Sphingobium sp.]|uniref:alpha/beta fold hydrolase n=1 Tax=Sphingobium sp. TaxID=1912891 RepID=UPI002ED52A5E
MLHGFFGAPWSVRPMGHSLRTGDGFLPFCPRYPSWALDFDAIVERMATKLASRAMGEERPVHFVGHSMGGLIARAVVDRLKPRHMGRMVMIGTPNGGSELADFCVRWRLLRPMLGKAAPTLVTAGRLPALDAFRPPDYPVGVIAGDYPDPSPLMRQLRLMPTPNDGRVSVASTHLDGQTDHIVLPVFHGVMPFNRSVQRQTAHFLKTGAFQH